jgi:hypothetical protein
LVAKLLPGIGLHLVLGCLAHKSLPFFGVHIWAKVHDICTIVEPNRTVPMYVYSVVVAIR